MQRLSAVLGCLGLALGTVFAGCGTETIGAIEGDGNGSGNGEGGANGGGLLGPGSGDGGGNPDAPARPVEDTREAYCAGSGPPVVAITDGGTVDTCDLAKKTFRYALCTCEGFVSSNALRTDAFDSTTGSYNPGTALLGGSVGTNGNFSSTGLIDIGGSLWASSASGITVSGASQARSEFHSAGNTSTGTSFTVGKDAWVASDWNANGNLTIGGTLTYPSNKTLTTGGTATIGATVRAPVTVNPACDCAPSQLLDVVALVESFRAKNDNVAMGIDQAALEQVQTATTVAVPCGRLFLTRIATSAPLTLQLAGRTAIFVAGDVALNGDFKVNVPPGAELDLFIGGNVVASGAFELGDQATPAKARAYVGGTGTINLAQTSTLAGNVYAPRGEVVLASGATVFGSIFARRVATQGDLTIHFDESIVTKGDTCPPPSGCSTCNDCGGEACIGGQCGACTSSSQCCSPLICSQGKCVPSVK